ncbi:CotO family spore coat protein [Ornithinibacillus contaminans]|uniref:CotO family spore coat protein n=1 Tax=Ornithinibacillus contaminans TaxID=694055 RepID=UPI00064DCCAA|nr:CotO family spore coat protein [Ornithinibacillus contaminans]
MPERGKFANEPLMYIQQPTVSKPTAPMQHEYRTPKKVLTTTSATEPTSPQKKTTNRSTSIGKITRGFVQELKEPQPVRRAPRNKGQETSTEKEKKSVEQPVSDTSTEKKKFKDMSLLEKVEYFVNTPSHLPKMRCEVKTDARSFRGIIKDFQDNQISMLVGRRTSTIDFTEVTDIRLLGF